MYLTLVIYHLQSQKHHTLIIWWSSSDAWSASGEVSREQNSALPLEESPSSWLAGGASLHDTQANSFLKWATNDVSTGAWCSNKQHCAWNGVKSLARPNGSIYPHIRFQLAQRDGNKEISITAHSVFSALARLRHDDRKKHGEEVSAASSVPLGRPFGSASCLFWSFPTL